jgi:hypothetical protein
MHSIDEVCMRVRDLATGMVLVYVTATTENLGSEQTNFVDSEKT